ncbi:MAG: pseudouridine synthase [Candidatus Omnitrophota bacterium]|nr:MAG: pseudouridine synthase [Candidatus Omnitrophota bacterium]
MKQRINKVIAQSGFCSRRNADALILAKKVQVNGKLVCSLGILVDPAVDKVSIEKKCLSLEKKVYLMLHKPVGFITSTKSQHYAQTVFSLLPRLGLRLYPVGRLDKNTSGLLILTNDGDLSYQITHPKFEVKRVYDVVVRGYLEDNAARKISKGGLAIDDYLTSPCVIKIIKKMENKTNLLITMHEGRKRQIRRMFSVVKHSVIVLKRIRFGKLDLGGLEQGKWKYIQKEEII